MHNDLSHELKRDRREALRDYSASLMSNTKWRAVFTALANPELAIRQIIAKFVGVEEEKPMHLPWLEAPHAFVDSADFGPFPLVGIEWIEIPATAIFPRSNNVAAERYAQDLVAIRSALEATGKQFPLQDSANGLRILGHVR